MNTNIYETPIYQAYRRSRDAGIYHDTFVGHYGLAGGISGRLRHAYALEKRIDAALAIDEQNG